MKACMTIEINRQAKPKEQPRRYSSVIENPKWDLESFKWDQEKMFLMDQYAQLKQQLEMEKIKDNV